MTMHVAVASDHAGFSLKEKVVEYLAGLGHTVEDLGTCDTTPVDYPDFAEAVAAAILGERVERAVLICGSGVGASVAANKFRGIRAGLSHDTYSAHQGVEHDHMNVLVLGGRDRKSTRLNSSHANISYAVFCLKKKKAYVARDID